jgi:hypothetical protein
VLVPDDDAAERGGGGGGGGTSGVPDALYIARGKMLVPAFWQIGRCKTARWMAATVPAPSAFSAITVTVSEASFTPLINRESMILHIVLFARAHARHVLNLSRGVRLLEPKSYHTTLRF